MKKYKALTRIDLLVIIVCVTLLLAISLPALNLPREMARRAFCAALLKNMGMANEMYADSNDGWFVPAGYPTTSSSGSIIIVQWVCNNTFRSYLQMDSYINADSGAEQSFYDAPDEFLCPSDFVSKNPQNAFSGMVLQSYGYNITDWGGRGDWTGMWTKLIGYNRSQVANPSEKLMITEGVGDWWLHWGGANYQIGWDVLGFSSVVKYRQYVPGGRGYGAVAYRHSEGLNILFYDAHVQWMPKEQAYVLADYNASPKKPGMWSVVNPYLPQPSPEYPSVPGGSEPTW